MPWVCAKISVSVHESSTNAGGFTCAPLDGVLALDGEVAGSGAKISSSSKGRRGFELYGSVGVDMEPP